MVATTETTTAPQTDRQSTTLEPEGQLLTSHREHLISEGFPPEQIDKWREEGLIFSVREDEAPWMDFKIWDAGSEEWLSGSGLYLKFTAKFGQVRLDTPIEVKDKNGKTRTVKYLTPHGAASVPMTPEGAEAWTEGWKDAQAGSVLGGIPTAAAAGISHYKIFPENSGLTTIADSDAWWNPNVFGWLFNSGLHQRGKCAIVPLPPGEKAGLVEYLKPDGNPSETSEKPEETQEKSSETSEKPEETQEKSSETSEKSEETQEKSSETEGNRKYRELLDGAVTPKQLLLEWPKHWKGAPPDRIAAIARKAARLAARHLSQDERTILSNRMAGGSDLTKVQVEKMLTEELKRINAESGDDEPKKDKPPIASQMAREIAEEYRDRLAYDDKSGRWLEYGLDNPGMWTTVSKEYVLSAIATILEGKGYSFSNGYVNDVFGLLRNKLLIRKWEERSAKEFLPFENGVLEIATGQLLDHAPGYRFTWQLPRQHNILAASWDNISQFLDEATGGNKALRNILVCFANALLKGRSDLQKFLFLIGRGGTGKGTLMRLLSALVGSNNVHSSTLEDFCGNQFESANAYQKRGVFFWDEDRKVGRLGKLKALTGGDWIRGEEKGMKAFQFQFDGMVAIAANYPIFAGDSSSGLSRRIITVPMNQRPAKRKNLEQLFEGELDAFTNYLLGLDDDFVTRVLLGEETVPAVEYEYWENRQRTDSIAAWLNDWAIFDPEAHAQVGNCKNEASSQYEATTLYGSYCLYCHQNGFNTKSSKNFSPDLLELCTSILGWQIRKVHTKTGKYIRGLRLRSHQDLEIPTYDFVLRENAQMTGDGCGDGSVTDGVTGRVTGQDVQPESIAENLPPPVTDKSKLGGEKEKIFSEQDESRNGSQDELSELKKNVHPKDNCDFTRHRESEIAQTLLPQEFRPVTQPVTQPVTNPSPDPSPPTEEDLEGIVEMLTEFSHEGSLDRDAMEALTSDLSDEDKKRVWGMLSAEVRDRLKDLPSSKQVDSQPVENPSQSRPTAEPFEGPDYSQFPWERETGWMPGEERDRTKAKKAERLRDELLAITSVEDDDKIFMKWGMACIRWVDANLLTPEQVARRKNLLESIANTEQQSLL